MIEKGPERRFTMEEARRSKPKTAIPVTGQIKIKNPREQDISEAKTTRQITVEKGSVLGMHESERADPSTSSLRPSGCI